MHLRLALSSHLKVCLFHSLSHQVVTLFLSNIFDLAQAVTLAQNHEHTLIILPKIVLAGLHVLRSSAGIAELSWACGRVFYNVLGVQIGTHYSRSYLSQIFWSSDKSPLV